ncbi:hypothetical protein A4R44_00050 [Amycolatopsis sp. M39]|uniref:Uncharacterized protein n=1 Tax=Amycolatopsis rubida TaxID=112413 RepID=A0A1I5W4Y7_9PSEU|nr:hypothetical protein A4R44_00050 [Amycolatopsis sp. M39]SFQ14316.1 hypothetical protein SAMN05421854_10947 [Amycolatopsis rubida]
MPSVCTANAASNDPSLSDRFSTQTHPASRPVEREAGRRRYAEPAVRDVGVVLFCQEISFTLTEIGRFPTGGQSGRQMANSPN